MAGAIVSEHWSTWMTQPVSTLARINSCGHHLLRKTGATNRPNNLTSISGRTCALFHPSWLLANSINLSFALLSWQTAPLSTFPACSSWISPQSLHGAHLIPTVIFFTLYTLLFPSIYFQISPYPSPPPSATLFSSFLSNPSTGTKYLETFPYRVSGFSSPLQGTASNSGWVCTRPHRPTWRLMRLLSKTAPRLNIDHQSSVPRTLREAICQGDNLFCSTRYGVQGIGLFFLHVV